MPVSDPITSVAALAESTRRRLYDYVVGLRRPVGRDEAAAALGLVRGTAAFHLDRLVEDGLLATVHQRRSGRRGPGAGRPAKLYLRSETEVAVSLPGRRYDLAGELFADAVEQSERTGRTVRESLAGCAREAGRALGAGAAAEGGSEVAPLLAAHGFEPYVEEGQVRLANCPFHDLAKRHAALVCGMNLELLGGILDGLGEGAHHARLDPAAGRCCVVVDGA